MQLLKVGGEIAERAKNPQLADDRFQKAIAVAIQIQDWPEAIGSLLHRLSVRTDSADPIRSELADTLTRIPKLGLRDLQSLALTAADAVESTHPEVASRVRRSVQGFSYFDHEELKIIYDETVRLQIYRKALLAAIDDDFVGSMPEARTPNEQYWSDLHELNRTEGLVAGNIPILQWLLDAEALAGPRTAVFADAHRKLVERR